MEENTLNINDITNGTIVRDEWVGTGIFDKLINTVNSNLAIQLESGRLTNSEFGSVYSNIVPSLINASMDFSLKKRFTELQIEGQLKDNLLKEKQLELTMLDIAAKTYSNTVILVDEHNKNIASISAINKDMDLKDAQIIGSGIDNSLKTKQIEVANIDISIKEIEKLSKQYENEILLIDKHSLNLKEIESSTKEIELKTQQITSMTIEDTIKQEQNTKDLEVKTQQITGMVKEDLIKEKQLLDVEKGTELKTQQIASMIVEDSIKEDQNTKDLEIKTKQAIDIEKGTELKTQQITSMTIEDIIKESQSTKDLEVKASQKLDIEKGTAVKTQQITSMTKEDIIKEAQSTKDLELKEKQIQSEYISIVVKDKEAVKLGMDKAFSNNNSSLKDVYTPIYKEV